MSAFVTSDLHIDHAKILSFAAPDGSPMRPYSCLEEMQQDLEERWNARVHKRDTCYVLGDVAFSKTGLRLMERFNGRKILISGNHDRLPAKLYLQYFDDIRGAYFHHGDSTFPGGLIFTHIPVHPSCLSGHYRGNVHGHLHCHRILDDNGQIDKRYFNCCLEVNDFAPVAFEDIKEFFRRGRTSSDIQHAHQGAMERSHSSNS
jgi:calcineurin-like phosphoesterase family protein